MRLMILMDTPSNSLKVAEDMRSDMSCEPVKHLLVTD